MGVLKANVGGVWVPVSQGFDMASVGYVGHAVATAAQSGITTIVDITGCAVAWVADPTHRYMTTLLIAAVGKDATAGHVSVNIANAGNGAIVQDSVWHPGGAYLPVNIWTVETGLSGAQTRKGRIQSLAGACSLTINAWERATILVEDITTVMPGSASILGSWTALPLSAGWTDFGGQYQVAQYRKVGDMVHVRGVIKGGTTTAGTGFATLPVGFRPPAALQFLGENAPTPGRFEVRADGTFVIIGAAFGATGHNINIAFSVSV